MPQLDNVEAAWKEADRATLRADFAAAAAISKVYEDASKEDEEQYLGSDDPGDDPECYYWPPSHGLRSQETFVKKGTAVSGHMMKNHWSLHMHLIRQ